MKTLLKEPLLHFLLIGAGLFVVDNWQNKKEAAPSKGRIVVSPGKIEQLATVFQKTWQRPPTQEELDGLIDDFILEEIYYRKAVAMGIDRDDTIVRRRLRQKLEFLTDDAAALIEPKEEDLAAFLASHPDKFRESSRHTFLQVYFNPEKHSDKTNAWFDNQLKRLKAGEEVGDPTLIREAFVDVDSREVDGTFGTGFAIELEKLETGKWLGPIRSGLGLHFMRIDERIKGRLPKLDEIRPLVEREWRHQSRLDYREKMNEELKKNYEIVIEWPEAKKSEAEPTSGMGS